MFFQPVVDCDVPVQVEVTMAELDDGQSCSGQRLHLVNARDALPQDSRDQLQHLSGRRRGEIDVGQDGVFRTSIL